jgi:hypothetical protein
LPEEKVVAVGMREGVPVKSAEGSPAAVERTGDVPVGAAAVGKGVGVPVASAAVLCASVGNADGVAEVPGVPGSSAPLRVGAAAA